MCSTHNSHRRGFTMLELLVVIGVIALMLALLMRASFSFITGSREAATATTITKVNQLLQDRLANFRQTDFTDAAQLYTNDFNSNLFNQSNRLSMSIPLADIIVRKYRMKQAFPQNLTEAVGARYTTMQQTIAASATYQTQYESGIVLYALLFSGETFGAPSVADDAFTSSELLISPATASLPCLVDSWGQPLRFYRWPTRLFYPNGITFNAQNQTMRNPVDRTYASLLMQSVHSPNGLWQAAPFSSLSPVPPFDNGADGQPGVSGVGGQGCYGSDDLPNMGPDGVWGIGAYGGGTPCTIGSDDFEPLNVDPDDPMLLLSTFLFGIYNVGAGAFIPPAVVSPLVFETGQGNTLAGGGWPYLHTPFTSHPMLIVSSGRDGQLGLGNPNDVPPATTFGYLACPTISQNGQALTLQYLQDNITNLNLRSSGK